MAASGAAAAVALGVVRGAFGIKGWLRIAPYSPDAEVLRRARSWWLRGGAVPGGGQRVQVSAVRRHGSALVAKWEGCDTPEAAEAWRGAEVAVERDGFPALPAGEFYWVDLLGARVVNRAGVNLGTVVRMDNNGAHDLLEVAADDGRHRLIPWVDAYIDAVDLAGRQITVDWQPDW